MEKPPGFEHRQKEILSDGIKLNWIFIFTNKFVECWKDGNVESQKDENKRCKEHRFSWIFGEIRGLILVLFCNNRDANNISNKSNNKNTDWQVTGNENTNYYHAFDWNIISTNHKHYNSTTIKQDFCGGDKDWEDRHSESNIW